MLERPMRSHDTIRDGRLLVRTRGDDRNLNGTIGRLIHVTRRPHVESAGLEPISVSLDDLKATKQTSPMRPWARKVTACPYRPKANTCASRTSAVAPGAYAAKKVT